jgi:hypothetical protein
MENKPAAFFRVFGTALALGTISPRHVYATARRWEAKAMRVGVGYHHFSLTLFCKSKHGSIDDSHYGYGPCNQSDTFRDGSGSDNPLVKTRSTDDSQYCPCNQSSDIPRE